MAQLRQAIAQANATPGADRILFQQAGVVTLTSGALSIDDAVQVHDEAMLTEVYALLAEEGLSVGGSAGLNVAAAIQVAREMGPGHTVATILCDGGARYQSKLFNPEFLATKGLPAAPWLRA